MKEFKIMSLFTLLFLLGGFIHVICGPWDFTSCIAQIYYSLLVLVWAVTIHNRIVNQRVRHLMLMTAGLFMLAFFLQMCRYRIFDGFMTACRFFWYGYYIPVLLVPVLFLFVVLYLHLQENEKLNARWLLMLLPSLCFILLIMTNDLHQLVFIFTGGTEGKYGTYTHGVIFYILYAWIILVLILSLCLAIRKCHLPGIRKKLWMPLYFAAFGILDILAMFELPEIGDVTIWLFVECLVMVVVGVEESCIQLGLIPANSSYQMIVDHVHKPFAIVDDRGIPVYNATAAREMSDQKENVQIYTKTIRGGHVSWMVDLTERMELNRQIEKATESIESKNQYLQTENALKEEQSRLAARNTLYNQIARIVSPQIEAIGGWLEGSTDDRQLAKIAFLNAYIKRRSNMELLKSDVERFPTEELASAILESCEYLKLCGVNAMFQMAPACELSADMQLFLYEAFEIVVENCLDTLKLLLVNVAIQKAQPVLRIALQAAAIDMDAIGQQLSSGHGKANFVSDVDEDEATIAITLQEGGVSL